MKQLFYKLMKKWFGLERGPTFCPAVLKTPTGITVSHLACNDNCPWKLTGRCSAEGVVWLDHHKRPTGVRRCYIWKEEDDPARPGCKVHVVYLKEQERLDRDPIFTPVATVSGHNVVTSASTADLIAYVLNKHVYGLAT